MISILNHLPDMKKKGVEWGSIKNFLIYKTNSFWSEEVQDLCGQEVVC